MHTLKWLAMYVSVQVFAFMYSHTHICFANMHGYRLSFVSAIDNYQASEFISATTGAGTPSIFTKSVSA